MSAHETRHPGESIFNMRQRHWEGLIAGKKTLHHGKLLPGSSTSDEDPQAPNAGGKPPPICWSEVSSPRKQVRITLAALTDDSDGGQPPRTLIPGASSSGGTADSSETTPIVSAIKDELQKFQRQPNLTGISIINDPELLRDENT